MDFVKNGYVNRNVLMSMYISADKPAKRREIREGYIRFCRNIVLRIKEEVIKEIIQSDHGAKTISGQDGRYADKPVGRNGSSSMDHFFR
jgi:hypothetical protein